MTDRQLTSVLIALGSNLCQPALQIERAWRAICESSQIEAIAISRFITTKPVGGPPEQPDFLNATALLSTDFSPLELLDLFHRIEFLGGRERREFWGARTIDLDILLYGSSIISTSQLTIPHPRMAWRPFVLEPANEIAPNMFHPVYKTTVRDLLNLARLNFRLAEMNTLYNLF